MRIKKDPIVKSPVLKRFATMDDRRKHGFYIAGGGCLFKAYDGRFYEGRKYEMDYQLARYLGHWMGHWMTKYNKPIAYIKTKNFREVFSYHITCKCFVSSFDAGLGDSLGWDNYRLLKDTHYLYHNDTGIIGAIKTKGLNNEQVRTVHKLAEEIMNSQELEALNESTKL
jgi:hypothetical protein